MFIPDAFKPDVVKFLDSNAGRALVIALRARKPAPPSSSETAHGMIQKYANAEGFEMAVDQLLKIASEGQPEEKSEDGDPFHVQKD